MIAPTVLPGRAFQRIDRVSRALTRWRAADLSKTPVSGETATFARAGAGGAVPDANGIVRLAAHSAPRFEMVDLDADAVRETPALVLEQARTNLLLRSEEFDNASWTKDAGAAATGNAAVAPDGKTTAELLTFSTGSVTNRVRQTYTIADPENRTFVFSIFLKDGTLGEGNNQLAVLIRRGDASDSSTYVAGDSSLKRLYSLGNGWSRWYAVKTFSASAVGDNVEVVLATNGATGTYYAWGAQLEEAAAPSSYLATTSATTARLVESLSWAMAAPPQAMTAYLRFVERGSIGISGAVLLRLGTGTARLELLRSGGFYQALHHNGSASVTSTAGVAPAMGQLVELRAVLSATGAIQLHQTLAAGTEASAVASAANALASAWSDTTLVLGAASAAGASAGLLALCDVTLAAGERTLREMRELL